MNIGLFNATYKHTGDLYGTPGSACAQPEPNATELPSCAPISARAARGRGPRRPFPAPRLVARPPQRPPQRPAPRPSRACPSRAIQGQTSRPQRQSARKILKMLASGTDSSNCSMALTFVFLPISFFVLFSKWQVFFSKAHFQQSVSQQSEPIAQKRGQDRATGRL